MDTVKMIMQLKSEGLSLRAIAEKFNAESVPTKTGKGKWGHEMVKRLIANEVLKKAEVKVGLVSENEIRLKEEVESLKAENEKINSVLVGYTAKQFEILDANRQLAEEIKLLYTVRQENERLKSDIGVLTTQKEMFKTEAERLQRQLSETELKFKNQYDSEINRLGSDLSIANQTIQELRDKQSFLSVDDTVRGKLGVPKNHAGWTTQVNGLGYIRLFRKMSGKQHSIYVGKAWNTETVDKKIAEYQEKKIEQLKFAIRKDTDEQLPVPLAHTFEDSLRMCCPEQRRTYRLDKVRLRFPLMQKSEFNRNMLGLASEYKIELVGGDPRECDMESLIRDTEMNITYVNFEWRA